MAYIKKRNLHFQDGHSISLTGLSIGITPDLEIGEVFTANIIGGHRQGEIEKPSATVNNPFNLTEQQIGELADFNALLWLELKENIRKYGLKNPDIFLKKK